MIGSSDRQRCFDYLLENLSADERLRFESQLAFDEELAAELRACDAELAAFAHAAAPSLAPPPSVWEGIAARLEAPPPVAAPVASRSLWKKMAWPLAASLLLAFNVWQLLYDDGDQSEQTAIAENGGSAGTASTVDSEGAASTEQQLRRQIDSLRKQIDDVSDQLAFNAEEREAQWTAMQLKALRERRDGLEERIESLEAYYLSLIELPRQLGVGGMASSEIEEALGVELAYSENLLLGATAGGIWDQLARTLADSSVAMLSLGEPFAQQPIGFDSVFVAEQNPATFASPPPVGETFAFAFVDQATRQAILSLGSLPIVGEAEQLVLWARGVEQERYTRVSELPSYVAGRSANIGIRVPETIEAVSDFVLTVEPAEAEAESETESADANAQPGERVVLQTVPRP